MSLNQLDREQKLLEDILDCIYSNTSEYTFDKADIHFSKPHPEDAMRRHQDRVSGAMCRIVEDETNRKYVITIREVDDGRPKIY